MNQSANNSITSHCFQYLNLQKLIEEIITPENTIFTQQIK